MSILGPLSLMLWMATAPAATPSPDSTAAPTDTAAAARLTARGTIGGATERGQMVEPAGVAVDAFGTVWVTDAQLHCLERFDRQGRWLGEIGSLGSDVGQMRRPGSVAALGAASVAVLDRENRRVLLYDLFGRVQGVRLDLANATLEERTGRIDPAWLATDRGGAIYIVDSARERVLVFDTSGQLVRTLGNYGAKPGSFRGLRALATAPRGEMLVTERLNARVQRLDAGGRPVRAWPLAIETRGSGALPIAVDDGGRVAVADEVSGRLWIFDAAGRVLAEERDLGRPRALAFAPDGALLVAQANPPQIRRFELPPKREP